MEAEPTHRELSRYAIGLLRGDCAAEVNRFRDVIEQASVDEDNGGRFLNHFYDPDTGLGLPVDSYTRVVEGQGPDPRPRAGPLGAYYLNALDWAWDGMPDHLDWTGAIDSYDYSEASRRRAYQAVGHVLHLVEDMGQPDHASCRPHPGNIAHKSLANASARIKRLARESGGIRDDRLGYEELWAQISPTDAAWRHGSRPKTLSSLAQAFDELARASKAAEADLGLPAVNHGEIALGLAAFRGWVLQGIVAAVITPPDLQSQTYSTAGLQYEMDIALVPTIPVPPGNWLTRAYLQLGAKLMALAEEYGAGLIELFHAIVNPPPFVSSVKIDQSASSSSGGMYWRYWEAAEHADGRVSRRALDPGVSKPLTAGRPARLEIGFGPCLQLGDTAVGKTVAVTSVHVEYDSGRREELMPFAADRTYVASFIPVESGTLAIDARDLGDHLDGRLPTGEELDSDPSTPARAAVSGSDPSSPAAYGWRHYEPGVDRNHKFTVMDRCQADSVRPAVWQAMRYGTLTGEGHLQAKCDWATHDGPGKGGGHYEYERQDTFTCRAVIWGDDWPVPSAYSIGSMQTNFGHMLDGQITENATVKYRPLRYGNVPSDMPKPKLLKFSDSRKPRNITGYMDPAGGAYHIGFDDPPANDGGRWITSDEAAEMAIPHDHDDIVQGDLPPWYPGIPPNVNPPWPAGPDTALCGSLTSSGSHIWRWGDGGHPADATFNTGSMEQSWTVTLSQSDDLPPHAVPELFKSYLPPEAIRIHAEAVAMMVSELVRSGAGSDGQDQQQWSGQLNDLWNQIRRAEQMQMPGLSSMKMDLDQLWLENADDAYNEGLDKLCAASEHAAVMLRGLETALASSVDRFAASMRAINAVTADRLAKLAQQLRTDGLKAFGAIVHC